MRVLTSLWWENAPSREKVWVVVMIAIGILVTAIGILGTAQHANLVARGSSYFVVTDAGEKSVSEATYDGLMYSQYVLGILGPAMAICGFVLLLFRAFSLRRSAPI